MVEWERVQRTMEILKWLGGAAGSLAQNVSVGTPTVSIDLPTCVLYRCTYAKPVPFFIFCREPHQN